MNANRSRVMRIVSIGLAIVAVGGAVAYAAIVMFRQDAFSGTSDCGAGRLS